MAVDAVAFGGSDQAVVERVAVVMVDVAAGFAVCAVAVVAIVVDAVEVIVCAHLSRTADWFVAAFWRRPGW